MGRNPTVGIIGFCLALLGLLTVSSFLPGSPIDGSFLPGPPLDEGLIPLVAAVLCVLGLRKARREWRRSGVTKVGLVLAVLSLVPVVSAGFTYGWLPARTGRSAVDVKNMQLYLQYVGRPMTAWVDASIAVGDASRALMKDDQAKFEHRVDRAISRLQIAQQEMKIIESPDNHRIRAAHAALVRRLGDEMRSGKRFRRVYRDYIIKPTTSAANRKRRVETLERLWDEFVDDGLDCAMTLKTWGSVIDEEAAEMGLDMPPWIAELRSRMEQAL